MHARQYILCAPGDHQRRSRVDEHNVAGSGRYLKLNGAFAGSGNLTFKDTGPAGAFTSADLGYILTGANTMSGTVRMNSSTRRTTNRTPANRTRFALPSTPPTTPITNPVTVPR